MFEKQDTSFKDYVLSLFKKDDECFEYFKDQCRQNGVHIFAVRLETKEQNLWKTVPYMSVLVTNEKDYKEYETDFGTRGIVNDRTRDIILPIWYETCKVFSLNVDDYYHPQMPIGLSRVDFTYYSFFTREYKQEIKDIITKEAGYEPKYVFASSGGYIAVIFSEDDYANIEPYKTNIIDSVLLYTDTVKKELIGDVELAPLSVYIFHLGMKNINLYGLSRED